MEAGFFLDTLALLESPDGFTVQKTTNIDIFTTMRAKILEKLHGCRRFKFCLSVMIVLSFADRGPSSRDHLHCLKDLHSQN